MRAVALLLSLCLPLVAHARDPWQDAAFDRLAKGRLEGVAILGTSPDGKRYAYVHAAVADGSGFLSVEAALAEIATGRALARFRIAGQDEPGAPAVMKRRKEYEAFLAKVRADGIGFDPARLWQKQAGRLVSPDGKLALRWRAGRERAGAADDAAQGRAFTAMLEDDDAHDHAALFELFAGLGADQVTRKAPPAFGDVYATADGSAFVLSIVSQGKQMCWDADDYYVQAFSLPTIRVQKPVRELNGAGMIAYHGDRLRDAQALFKLATVLDPGAARPRYNLAAVSAKLGDDDVAIAQVAELSKGNREMLRWKLATDDDFAAARKRPRFVRKMVELGVMAPQPD